MKFRVDIVLVLLALVLVVSGYVFASGLLFGIALIAAGVCLVAAKWIVWVRGTRQD